MLDRCGASGGDCCAQVDSAADARGESRYKASVHAA